MMPSLWIVHREPELRTALARLAAAPDDGVSGGPGDPVFDAAPAPEVVLLGLAGDLEAELEFAHRLAPRLPASGWVLLAEPLQLPDARRLFDVLPAELLTYPPQAAALRAAIRRAAARPESEPLPLSARPARAALADRFARGFADLELPGLLRALDPRLRGVPVLILGEPGSGRGILARYLHHFGAGAGGALVELPCSPETSAQDLLEAMRGAASDPRSRRSCTLWLEDADQLAPALARRVRSWLESGSVPGGPPSATLHWIASAAEPGLDPGLRRALSGLTLRVPPLRERGSVVALADACARAWCAARSIRPRRLGEDALAALEEYPWPGNLRELEAVIEQSLAASANDPLGRADLVLDAEPFAPLALTAGPPEPARAGTPAAGPPEPAGARAQELPAEEELEGLLDELDASEATAGAVPLPAAAEGNASSLRRLAASLGHELRNPLTAVRTFAELLPERHADPDFRERFGKLALDGLARVERVLDRLEQLGSLSAPERRRVDVGALLRSVLADRRQRIHERRLLVLEELERKDCHALCDPVQLRFALEALLDQALELVPERGDLYLASRHHASGAGDASVRVLLRYRRPEGRKGPRLQEVTPDANAVEFAVADLVVRAQGGTLTLDASDGNETVIVIDLPA